MEHGKPFSATDGPLVDFDAVCQKVRAAVEPARAHAVSLHDEHGDVLWLGESSMGPDEHNAVREAVEAFSGAGSPPVLVYDLGDSRSAVLLRAVNARRAMVGAIMLIMDARIVRQDTSSSLKVMTPKLQRALADFASMRPDSAAPPAPPARVAAAPARPTAPPTTAPAPTRPTAPRAMAATPPQPTAPRTMAPASPASGGAAAIAGHRPQAAVTPEI